MRANCPSLPCCSICGADACALPKCCSLCGATLRTRKYTDTQRRAARAANPPRARPPDASAGASWVLTSLIREASLGVGLGVVFGAVWSTMQTGPVSKRIVEYYKNNPTQS